MSPAEQQHLGRHHHPETAAAATNCLILQWALSSRLPECPNTTFSEDQACFRRALVFSTDANKQLQLIEPPFCKVKSKLRYRTSAISDKFDHVGPTTAGCMRMLLITDEPNTDADLKLFLICNTCCAATNAKVHWNPWHGYGKSADCQTSHLARRPCGHTDNTAGVCNDLIAVILCSVQCRMRNNMTRAYCDPFRLSHQHFHASRDFSQSTLLGHLACQRAHLRYNAMIQRGEKTLQMPDSLRSLIQITLIRICASALNISCLGGPTPFVPVSDCLGSGSLRLTSHCADWPLPHASLHHYLMKPPTGLHHIKPRLRAQFDAYSIHKYHKCDNDSISQFRFVIKCSETL